MSESEKKKKKNGEPPANNNVDRSPSKGLFYLLCAAVALPYLFLAADFWEHSHSTALARPIPEHVTPIEPQTSAASAASTVSEKPQLLKPGPWGDVEYIPLFIECPDEYLSAQNDATADRRWFFEHFSVEQLKAFLDSIPELSADERRQLTTAKFETAPTGLYVTPPRDVVLSMSEPARKKVYRLLTQFAENNWQREAYVLPVNSFDGYFKDSGVSTETVNLVRKLCYSYGKLLLFADLPYVLDTLPTFEQKQRLEKAISRRSTLLLRLHVHPRSDINALVNYWGRAGTTKDLKPLLQSVGKLPQGERVNIALLLPPLPTSRLYTYPFPSFNQPENCHWTSFNFFRDPPDNRYSDIKYLKEKLDSDYYPMFTDPRYGDLIFLTKPNGDIVHSAVFIADDVVFTKNGGHFSAPWMFMRLPELVDSYGTFVGENESLKVLYYRNKYF